MVSSGNSRFESPARKAASAAIAKIPFELSQYVAKFYYEPHSKTSSSAATSPIGVGSE